MQFLSHFFLAFRVKHGFVFDLIDSDYQDPSITNVSMIVCKKGYTLPRPGNNKLFCRNSQWVGGRGSDSGESPLPSCQLIDCGRPPTPANAKLIDAEAFSYKSNALVVCYQDYVLTIGQGQGPKVTGVKRTKVTCSADGNWRARVKMLNSHYDSFVPLNMVNCRPLECPQPDAISLGMVEFSGLTVGSMARYSCQRGYIMHGRAQRRCMPNGHWSFTKPLCTLPRNL